MVLIISVLALTAWVYLITFRGGFWRSAPLLDARMPVGRPRVVVIVPARNEAESIHQSLASLLAQDYPGELAIIVVDDSSTDGTAEIAASLASDQRLSVHAGSPLPTDWSGKLWAVHQGLAHERTTSAEYVLLTDADVVHAADHLSSLVAKAESDRFDLVSEMVRLNCVTAAERAMIPAFVFFFQMLYPFSWVANPKRRTAAAAGGTMLVSRLALDRIEGVSGIRRHLIDDCALAKRIKSVGGRIWLGHSETTRSVRIYSCWREIWNMIARTAYEQLGHSLLMLIGCVAGMAILFCSPPLLSLFANGIPRLLGVLSWLMMALAFQPTLHRYRRSPFWGIALPGISVFYTCATLDSARRHYAGHGGGWKSRIYPRNPMP